MRSLASAAVVATSVVSLGLAGTAIYVSHRPESSAPAGDPVVATEEDREDRRLGEAVRHLTAEVETLRSRLEALENAGEANEAPFEGDPEDRGDAASTRSSAALRARVVETVEAVMEERGEEYLRRAQSAAKRAGARDGITSWVRSRRDLLPALRERIAQGMELDWRRQREVTDIIEGTFESMTNLTELLHADPPPSDEESLEIMGEVKGSIGEMILRLDEVLEDDELVRLGEIAVEAELPRLGWAIIEEGKKGGGIPAQTGGDS